MHLIPPVLALLSLVAAVPLGEIPAGNNAADASGSKKTEDASTVDQPVRALDKFTHLFSGKNKKEENHGLKNSENFFPPHHHGMMYPPGADMIYPPPYGPPIPPPPPPGLCPGGTPTVSTKYMVKLQTETETVTSYEVDTEYETYTTTVTDAIYSTKTHVFYPEHTHTFTRTQELLVFPGYTMEAVRPVEPVPCYPPAMPCAPTPHCACEGPDCACGSDGRPCDICPLKIFG